MDRYPEFEIVDLQGSTTIRNDTVGTTEVVISNGGKCIQEFALTSLNVDHIGKIIKFRFEASGDYYELGSNCSIAWTPKSTTEIRIVGVSADTKYQIIINWEVD